MPRDALYGVAKNARVIYAETCHSADNRAADRNIHVTYQTDVKTASWNDDKLPSELTQQQDIQVCVFVD